MGGLALFRTVHTNFGPGGPSASKLGLCGSIWAVFLVDVVLCFVAEGRAGWGQVKNDAMFTFSETKWRTQNKHDKK